MTQQREQKRRARKSQIATFARPDADTFVLRTFWSPLPSWIYGTGSAAIIAGIAALAGLATGSSGSDIQTVALFAAVVGYFAGAIGWAIVGVAGGDRLEVSFNRREDIGHVEQSLFWIWRRSWTFELDEISRLHVWAKRGRFLFKLSRTEIVDLTFANDDESANLGLLNLGRYPTEIEGMEVGTELKNFLDIPISRNPPEK